MKKEAMYYEVKNEHVYCQLCPHFCVLKKNQRGICKVRLAQQSKNSLSLYTENYAKITSFAIDPMKKKPFAFYHPKSLIMSVGSFGCNFSCTFCQNFSIFQAKAESSEILPARLVDIYEEVIRDTPEVIGVAFTYNEPSIWYEYVLESSKVLKQAHPDAVVVLVTNGFLNPKPLRQLLPYVDALNIDLKGTEAFYRELCGGRLPPVLESIKLASEAKKHIEVTTLLVPFSGHEDNFLIQLVDFLASVDEAIPLHLTRYFPCYQMKQEATTIEAMKQAYELASAKLSRVVVGNVSEDERLKISNNF